MDLNYLVNEILPQRAKEIRKGENAATAQPIYVVLDLQENYCSGHCDYSPSTNYREKDWQHGYFKDLGDDEKDFVLNNSKEEDREPVTKFYTDRIVAFFLTRRAAKDYLRYQKHNLSMPYIYVFYTGYANREMNTLLANES